MSVVGINQSLWLSLNQSTINPECDTTFDGNIDNEEGSTGLIIGWVRDIALGIVLGFLCLLTAVGNALVLHAVRTERNLQTVSNMYIVSLAIADLTVGLIVMPISAIYIFTETWLFGVVICQFWIGVDYLASTASILNLFILSLDRYWSVMSPLKYLRKRTKKRALLMITAVWFVSSLWLIPIIGWHYFEHNGIRTVPNDVCDTEYATNTALKIVTGILNYYLPLAVMYCLYTKIFIEIKTRSKMEVGQKISGASIKLRQKEANLSYSDTNDDPASDGMFSSTSHTEKDRFVIQNKIVPSILVPYINNKPTTETDTDGLTANTDDELANKCKVPLLRISGNNNLDNDGTPDSEYESRFSYNYDEMVVDPTTEKIQRFYYEDKNNSCNNNTDNKPHETLALLDLKETSFHSTVVEEHHENRVHLNVPESDESKTHLTFPKEHHPAKNHHIKGYLRPNGVQNIKSPSYDYLSPLSRGNSVRSMDSSRSPTSHSNRNDHNGHHRRTLSARGSMRRAHNGHHSNSTNPTGLKKLAVTFKPRSFSRKRSKMSSSLSREIKAIRQLGVIMGAFTVCFFPYFVCFMVVAFCESCVTPQLLIAVTWIGYLNSTLNPFLYPLCNAAFRRKFRKMLQLGSKNSKTSYCLNVKATPRTSLIHQTGGEH